MPELTDKRTRELLSERISLKTQIRALYKRVDQINERLIANLHEAVSEADARQADRMSSNVVRDHAFMG